MKLKKAKKHVKRVRLVLNFDNKKAAMTTYERISDIVRFTMLDDNPGSYIRAVMNNKKNKVILEASSVEILEYALGAHI